jgi:small subunit ribosomal protein S2
LADAIYEGRHGQLDAEAEEDYEDYEGAEDDIEYEEIDSAIPDEEEEETEA